MHLEDVAIADHHLLVRVLGERSEAKDALPLDDAIVRAAPGKAHDHGGTQAERMDMRLDDLVYSPHLARLLFVSRMVTRPG
jgi:hypothetical protein